MFEYAKWHSNTSSNPRHENPPPCRHVALRRLREGAPDRAPVRECFPAPFSRGKGVSTLANRDGVFTAHRRDGAAVHVGPREGVACG